MTTATTLDQADERLHELLLKVTTAARKSGPPPIGAVHPAVKTAPDCQDPGTARHTVIMSLLQGAGSADVGPQVRADLQKQGWTMGGWRAQGKRGRYTSPGKFGKFTIFVSYVKGFGETDVLANTPCLKGSPLTKPSMFPEPGSTDPQ
ncbi:hypothetical protein ACFV09_41665 [Streptomyces sp. NPDC059631]|uniref:hypothetical protein n=1 Tax=Streptomyces sp. NPDC059631 TaxID=3346890 RepID=UPI0036B2C088